MFITLSRILKKISKTKIIKTLRDLDHAVTASLNGFNSAEHYYEHARGNKSWLILNNLVYLFTSVLTYFYVIKNIYYSPKKTYPATLNQLKNNRIYVHQPKLN